MYRLKLSKAEYWDDDLQEFVYYNSEGAYELEHSLAAISKWESIWKKPFISSREEKTKAEFISYIHCMTINQRDGERIFYEHADKDFEGITPESFEDLFKYVNESMTAYKRSELAEMEAKKSSKRNRSAMISDRIYAYLVGLQIPFEVQYWHFSKMMALIEIVSDNNKPPQKIDKKKQASNYAALNAARRAKHHTKG